MSAREPSLWEPLLAAAATTGARPGERAEKQRPLRPGHQLVARQVAHQSLFTSCRRIVNRASFVRRIDVVRAWLKVMVITGATAWSACGSSPGGSGGAGGTGAPGGPHLAFPIVNSYDGALLAPLDLITIVSQTQSTDADFLFGFSSGIGASGLVETAGGRVRPRPSLGGREPDGSAHHGRHDRPRRLRLHHQRGRRERRSRTERQLALSALPAAGHHRRPEGRSQHQLQKVGGLSRSVRNPRRQPGRGPTVWRDRSARQNDRRRPATRSSRPPPIPTSRAMRCRRSPRTRPGRSRSGTPTT